MIEITKTNSDYNIKGDITTILKNRKTHNSVVKVICNPLFEGDERQLMDNICEHIKFITNFTVSANYFTEISKTNKKILELTFQILW